MGAAVHRAVRARGADHAPGTLAYRRCTGECGERVAAQSQFRSLYAHCDQVLGSTDPLTLNALQGLARWTGEAGFYREARSRFTDLYALQAQLTPDDVLTLLDHRANIAVWAGQCGEAQYAMAEFTEILRTKQDHLAVGLDDEALLGSRVASPTGPGRPVTWPKDWNRGHRCWRPGPHQWSAAS